MTPQEQFRIGIDVGGTFTDLVAIDSRGNTMIAKSPSTPKDPSDGVMAGLGEIAAALALNLPDLLTATAQIVHGTTIATNALLERNGAKVGMLTTAGHRDVIEMREGLKPDRYDLRMPHRSALVSRDRRRPVVERIGYDGRVLIPLDEESLDQSLALLQEQGTQAIAVCYLHSYRDPAHEIQTLDRIREAHPDIYVSLSSDVLSQIKEYERFSTTVVNAYVGPLVSRYLENFAARLSESGFTGELLITLSHGGNAPVSEVCRLPAATVLSGPAGGGAGVKRCAELLDVGDLIAFDMGGTSTDISLVEDGTIALRTEGGIGDLRIALRSLEIVSIGAGGGSLVTVDGGGTLHIGPESAGAMPGPACYGNGGTGLAVTDANLVLGFLAPDRFLGGRHSLDQEASEAVLRTIADQIGLSLENTAAGIFRLVNLRMADGVRKVTLRRGIDPRKFTLLSFGGAAGLHAVDVARVMEIGRVIVPTAASVLSAWGMLESDLRFEVAKSHIGDSRELGTDLLRDSIRSLERDAALKLRSWFDGPVRFERMAEMRYGEQIFEIDVSLDGLDLDCEDLLDQIVARFHARHEELYTYSLPGQDVVVVNLRVAAIGDVVRPTTAIHPSTSRPTHQATTRRIYLDQWTTADVYALDALTPGDRIFGPAIVESDTTTVLIGPEDRATVNALGWLDIQVALSADNACSQRKQAAGET